MAPGTSWADALAQAFFKLGASARVQTFFKLGASARVMTVLLKCNNMRLLACPFFTISARLVSGKLSHWLGLWKQSEVEYALKSMWMGLPYQSGR